MHETKLNEIKIAHDFVHSFQKTNSIENMFYLNDKILYKTMKSPKNQLNVFYIPK